MSKRLIALAVALTFLGSSTTVYAASPKPTLAQIEAAKKAEAAKKKAADAAAKKLAAANMTLKALTAQANAAQALYVKAKAELAKATADANAAAEYARKTAEEVAGAHRTIGKLAVNAYMMGGTFSDIEPLLLSGYRKHLPCHQLRLWTSNSQASNFLNLI